MEIKPINGFEDYKITDTGIVFSTKGKRLRRLKPIKTKQGYCQVCLRRNNKAYKLYIHRIVAFHFSGKPKFNEEVNHKNGIKSDNNVTNLEWVTSSENSLHRCHVLKNQKSKKLNDLQISIIKRLLIDISQAQIAKYFNVAQQTISNINTGVFYCEHSFGNWKKSLL